MTVEEALSIVERILGEVSLNDLQEAIFRQSWEQKTYPEMAAESGYDADYIKVVGFRLWKMLSLAIGEKVTKDNLRSTLRRWHSRNREGVEKGEQANNINSSSSSSSPSSSSSLSSPTSSLPLHSPSSQDWGDAIDVSVFYGRSQELVTLEQWITQDRCRLVALLGIGGIGKTSLSVKLGEKLQEKFEYVIWRSLRNAPTIELLLLSLIQFLSCQQESELPASINDKISRLLRYLQQHRCLLILDNLETILCSSKPLITQECRTGYYREGYEGYAELFKKIGELRHQSCLVLTSREKPREIAVLEGETLPVRSMQLSGLSTGDGQAIFRSKGSFTGSIYDWQNLVQSYAGNPLALKIVATTIRDLFDSDISRFLSQGAVVFGDIQELIEQQFRRLSSFEKDIMYWLVINREPVTFTELQADLLYPTSNSQLLEVLESLERRSLLEICRDVACNLSTFTLQPVLMEYVTSRLIQQVCLEISQWGKWGVGSRGSRGREMLPHLPHSPTPLFATHALIKATAKDYIREIQIHLILKPVTHHLVSIFGTANRIKTQLMTILASLRGKKAIDTGYASGNIINLFRLLKVNLSCFDFSGLTIWQADFQGIDLHQTNFAHSDLTKSTFTANLSYTFTVAVSPDGRLLATGDTQGNISLWQTANGQLCLIWGAHKGWIRSITFSANGQTLFSGSDDQTVKRWDLTGRCLQVIEGHTGWVFSVALAQQCNLSDHSPVVVSSGMDQTIKLWNIQTGECLKTLRGHEDWIWSIAFSPLTTIFHQANSPFKEKIGGILASGSSDQTIKLWDVNIEKCLKTLRGHTDVVWSIAFSVDGKMLVSGGADGTVRVWDVSTGQCLHTLSGHTDHVWNVTCSSDGNSIASGSGDTTIRLWNIHNGECLKILHGHTNGVRSLTFTADGQTLIASDDDQTVKFWEICSGQCFRTIRGYGDCAWTIAISPPHIRLTLSQQNHDANDQILASGHEDQTVKLWDIKTGTCFKTLRGHTNRVKTVAFCPNGTSLASGGSDEMVRIWDIRTGECLHILRDHTSWVLSVAYSPNGQTLASGGSDKQVRLWDVNTGELLCVFQNHTSVISFVVYNLDGNLLISCSEDSSIQGWDVQTGRCVRTFAGHTNGVWSAAFNPNGQTLVSSSEDTTIKIWDVRTCQCLLTLRGHSCGVITVAYSPDGRLLASGSSDQTIRIWDVETGECLRVLRGHTRWVYAVAFIESHSGFSTVRGPIVVSSSEDQTIRFWDLDTGECLKILRTPRPYEGMNITGVVGLTKAQQATLMALGAIISK